ncbi:AAA family ATPase [uncultured Thiodictyon sp.]|jgi:ABC-type multidrug transport system ATPase subunit|uniref:AAA family ATPase n=1 Tax=uncultured Thiodictyon sp. TaxID=1846217 RepID=UPI0025D0C7CD|nr:ATP-binding protein [uncultured Thiodictyon sp.]
MNWTDSGARSRLDDGEAVAIPTRLSLLSVDNFKSLVDFRLPLADFTCLIGLNGSGKSTVIQAVDFIACLFKGSISRWLEQRQWSPADLNSKLIRKSNITVGIALRKGAKVLFWKARFNRTSLKCTQERVSVDKRIIFSVDEGSYAIPDEREDMVRTKIAFEYEGSVLSQLKDEILPSALRALKGFLQSTVALDLLAPQFLRKKTNSSRGDIGLAGERLSAFLHDLSTAQRTELLARLQTCYPQLSSFFTRSLRAGWKELNIKEQFGNTPLTTEAKHVNDGMLRLMAILAEILTEHKFVLFDEIENGINPELVEFLLDILVGSRQQVLVTTHSPMILNYLDDDVARRGVQYLYKTPEGYTRSVPFFSIPSVSEKLEVMGPGEAFVDTNLTRLQGEIQAMTAGGQGHGDADPR